MSMLDNPILGDYTKGISTDPQAYYARLAHRFLHEHKSLEVLARDMRHYDGLPNAWQIVQAVAVAPRQVLYLGDKSKNKVFAPTPVPVYETHAPAQARARDQARPVSKWQKIPLSELRQRLAAQG